MIKVTRVEYHFAEEERTGAEKLMEVLKILGQEPFLQEQDREEKVGTRTYYVVSTYETEEIKKEVYVMPF